MAEEGDKAANTNGCCLLRPTHPFFATNAISPVKMQKPLVHN